VAPHNWASFLRNRLDGLNARAPLEFITENGSFVKVFKVDYHGGERYPWLMRIEGMHDRLTEILAAKRR